MKTRVFFISFFVLFVLKLNGQDSTYRKFPIQITFVYPIGLHGIQSVDYQYDFSVNMLVGVTGSIDGCELAGLLNSNKGDVNGFQAAGIANNTLGDVNGVQMAGIYSTANNLDGAQINGIFSECNESCGIQISGIANFSSGAGSSIAGIVNINKGNQNGLQMAGIYNETKTLEGVQIGLINISDTITSGLPIGLISLVKKGAYDEWTFSVADYYNLGISYKLGVKQLYTIYSVGMNLVEEQLWVAGMGIGHLSDISTNFSIQPELVWYTYLPMDFNMNRREAHVTHFKLGLVKHINSHLAISFAPSIYLAFKWRDRTDRPYGFEQSPIGEFFDVSNNRKNKTEFGMGFSFAVHIK